MPLRASQAKIETQISLISLDNIATSMFLTPAFGGVGGEGSGSLVRYRMHLVMPS
jgi:hypothetical protein